MIRPTYCRIILTVLASAALTTAALSMPASALAGPPPPPKYSITLAGPNPSALRSTSAGINASGTVGATEGNDANAQSYRFGSQGLRAYGRPPGVSMAFSNAINGGNSIAARAGNDIEALNPYVAVPQGNGAHWTELLGPGKKVVPGTASTIDSEGDLAGWYYGPKDHTSALWWPKTTGYAPKLLPVPAGTAQSYVNGIDDARDLTGDWSGSVGQGVVWEGSGHRDLLPGPVKTQNTGGAAIVRTAGSSPHILVGGGTSPQNPYTESAAMWTITPSSTPSTTTAPKPQVFASPANYSYCLIRALNVASVAVGECDSFTTNIATLIWHGHQYDLNTLIPANTGWQLSTATGINAKGQITGNGSYKGNEAAFILNPK